MSAVQSQEQTLTGTAAATNDQVSGGFRIESSSDGMIVTKTPYNDLLRLLGFAIVAVFFSFLFMNGRFGSLLVIVLLALVVVQAFLGGVRDLRCTRQSLEVMYRGRGRLKCIQTYPREQIKRIRFGVVSFVIYGTGTGLLFEVNGKRVKSLSGLKSIEAQTILDKLQLLGYDVERDPGMPMMVEMEQSRRNSWWRFLLP